ncbi:vacuolar protein sorting-associated [Cladochytrium replicatum]|nr:vacuolar protein sorting-associated [Cladochytrium replicatum]
MTECCHLQEVRLYTTNKERENHENTAELYSIVAKEHRGRAHVRDAITAQVFTPACNKLIERFKTALNLLRDEVPDVERFMQEYRYAGSVDAIPRLVEIYVPATVEHTAAETPTVSKRNVAELTQEIATLLVVCESSANILDQIHPQLSGLMQTLCRFALSERMED